MTRISETDLILPTLFLLKHSRSGLSTTQLNPKLRDLLHPSGEDLAILKDRNDTRFDQIVRNLVSHKALSRRGLALEDGSPTVLTITDQGRRFLNRYKDDLNILFNFSLDDISNELSSLARNEPRVVLDERTVIEGKLRVRTQEYRTRSRYLRDAAIEHYSISGHIMCKSCEFEFAAAYPGVGDGYIQIHHIKPVSYMRGEEIDMDQALANVCPLCANCHQMVHRSTPPLSIVDLQSHLRVSYTYT